MFPVLLLVGKQALNRRSISIDDEESGLSGYVADKPQKSAPKMQGQIRGVIFRLNSNDNFVAARCNKLGAGSASVRLRLKRYGYIALMQDSRMARHPHS
jgi:hypothetical protein